MWKTKQTLLHFDTNTVTHTSAWIQMHNHTQGHSNMLLYICTVYSLCIVADAVLCMLTCRWNMTIIHRRGCAGRPSHWIASTLSALHLLPLISEMYQTVLPHPFLLWKVLFSQTAALIGLKLFEGTHNLAFDVRQNLAAVSMGRQRKEGGQTGALQLSGSTQSGTGHPASNCLFILCQKDLHISMSLCTAKEVQEQSMGEQRHRKRAYFDQKWVGVYIQIYSHRILFSERQSPRRVQKPVDLKTAIPLCSSLGCHDLMSCLRLTLC